MADPRNEEHGDNSRAAGPKSLVLAKSAAKEAPTEFLSGLPGGKELLRKRPGTPEMIAQQADDKQDAEK